MAAQNIQRRLAANRPRILGLAFCQTFLILLPIIVPFFQSRGLTMQQVFLLQALYGLVVLVMEVPSGYLADVWGRRPTLLFGAVCNALGHAALLADDGPWGLIVFEVLLGIGGSMISGADLALLYDSEKALAASVSRHEQAVQQLFLARNLAEAVASVVCVAVLAVYPIQVLIVFQVVVGALPVVFAIGLHEPSVRRLSLDHGENFTRIFAHLWRGGDLLRQILLALAIWPLSTFYAVWLLQEHWQNQGIDLVWFGLLWAGLMGLTVLAGRVALATERSLGSTVVLWLIGLAPVVGYLGLATGELIIGMLAACLFFVARGLGLVVLRDAFNRRVPAEFRATAHSLTNFGFRLGFAATAPVIGWVVDSQDVTMAYRALAAAALLIFIWVIVPLVRTARRSQQAAGTQVAEVVAEP